jgi:transcriptional regulator with XRE-family HTH domain
VDPIRLGRSLRVIRRSRGQRQLDVAQAAGVSQTLVSAVERGHGARLSVGTLARVFAALDADLELVVRYRGGTLDRLLDERHAATVAAVLGTLRARGWTTAVEVTFNHYGDRGSIDVLAVHPVARIVLVVEVKTEITSAEETLRRLDVKVRVGAGLARAVRVAGDTRCSAPRGPRLHRQPKPGLAPRAAARSRVPDSIGAPASVAREPGGCWRRPPLRPDFAR